MQLMLHISLEWGLNVNPIQWSRCSNLTSKEMKLAIGELDALANMCDLQCMHENLFELGQASPLVLLFTN